MCAGTHRKPEEGVGSPGAGVTGSLQPGVDAQSRPLEEQRALFKEPSLQCPHPVTPRPLGLVPFSLTPRELPGAFLGPHHS